MVWHNGLPLPVVDSPEQENCPPPNVPVSETSRPSRLESGGQDYKKTSSTVTPSGGEVLRTLPRHASSHVVKRPITEVGLSDDEGTDSVSATGITLAGGDLDKREKDPASVVDVDIEENGETKEADSTQPDATAVGSRETGKRTKFTLRRSIMERFQRCGIDFTTFAPP